MNRIDWHYLKRPLIMLLVSIVIFAALVLAGYQYEKTQSEEYQKALSLLRSTHKIYSNMVNDIDLLDQYRNLYNDPRVQEWVVPEGHYFMMGDNRDQSNDSRFWGFVPDENVVGRAFAVWMHKDPGLSMPTFSTTRWIR